MKKTDELFESLQVTILLTLSGGLMDAYSYLCRGGVFANAQTGNILLFGVYVSTGSFYEALRYLLPVLLFSAGIALAAALRYYLRGFQYLRWQQLILLAEAFLFVVAALLPQSMNLLANSLISFACGAQVESFRMVLGNGISTTMCIGNLRLGVQSICEFHFTRNNEELKKGLLSFTIIFTFVIGAVIGNGLINRFQEYAIFASSGIMMLVFLIISVHKQ